MSVSENENTASRPQPEPVVDTVAALPDRAAIMRPKREPRRGRRRGRPGFVTAAALALASAAIGIGLHSYLRPAPKGQIQATASRPASAGPAARAAEESTGRIELAEPLEGRGSQPPASSSGTAALRDAAPEPPVPPQAAPIMSDATDASAQPAHEDHSVDIAVTLPQPAAPLSQEDFAVMAAPAAPPSRPELLNQSGDGGNRDSASPAAGGTQPAIATGRVIAQTETPLPPPRPRQLTPPTPSAQAATTAPGSQADRTTTREVATRTRVVVHYSALDPEGRTRAEQIARRLSAEGFEVADLRPRGVEIMTSNVRYYHPQDRFASSVVRDIVEANVSDLGDRGTLLRSASSPVPASKGVVEVWLASWSQ